MPVKALLAAMMLLLVAPAAARAADRCGRSSVPAGAGSLELSLWRSNGGAQSEVATLSIPARGDRFAMVLRFRPARGRIGAPDRVETFAYGLGRQQVLEGDVLTIGAGRARWRGPPWITGLSSRSGRGWGAAEYLIAGGQVPPDPPLIRAFAAGGKARLVRERRDGLRVEDVVELPRPKALNNAYLTARAQAAAAMRSCPPPTAEPVSAP